MGLALAAAALHGQACAAASGQDIAENGTSGGAPACSACHGPHGEGNPETGYPRLAGLNAAYMVHQLDSFADGARPNDIMKTIAEALQAEDRRAVAQFYAGQSAPKAAGSAAGDAKLVEQGKRLALDGDWSKGLPACAQCHGPGGQGVGAAFPALAGQSATYLETQLDAWRKNERKNDPLHLMAGIAGHLSDADVKAVAAYYASLDVPRAAARAETAK